jgi:hypothetical protein
MRRITVTVDGIAEQPQRQHSGRGGAIALIALTILIAALSMKPKAATPPVTDTTTVAPLTPASLSIDQKELRFTGPAAQIIRLTNSGDGLLTIQPPVVIGTAFHVSSDCNTPLERTASCAVTVSLDPTADGNANGELRITSNGGSATVSLISNASPAAPLELPPLDFGSRVLGTTGTPGAVHFTNSTPAVLTLGGASTAAPFRVIKDDCATTIEAGVGCDVALSFDPVTAGPQTGDLRIVTTDGKLVAHAALSGEAVAPPLPQLQLPPVSFGRQPVGRPGKPRIAHLTNTTQFPLSLAGASTDPPFIIGADRCRNTALPPGSDCTISLTFSPTAEGEQEGEVRIANSDQKIIARGALTGSGFIIPPPRPQLALQPIDFGRQPIGKEGKPRVLVLTNTTANAMALGSAATEPPFRIVADGCHNQQLAPGTVCRVLVAFTASAETQQAGEIRIAAPDGYVIARGSLSGLGIVQSPPQIDIEPQTVNFNGDGGARPITISNRGKAPVSITARFQTKPISYLLDASACDRAPLAPDNQCRIMITSTREAYRLSESAVVEIAYEGHTELVQVIFRTVKKP